MPEETFGQLLKRLREERNLSQSALAVRSGLEHSYISRLESGYRNPTNASTTLLADALTLDQYETACLLSTAGFSAKPVTDPIELELLDFLQDPAVPAARKRAVTIFIHTILEYERECARLLKYAGSL